LDQIFSRQHQQLLKIVAFGLKSNKGSHSKRISGAALVISQARSSGANHVKTILSYGSSGGGLQEKNKSVATTAMIRTTATRTFLQP